MVTCLTSGSCRKENCGYRMDRAFASFMANHKNDFTACHGQTDGRYLVAVGCGRIHIVAEGEPPQGCYLAVIDDVLNCGRLQGPVTVLMDLTAYTGVVEWDVVSQGRDRIEAAHLGNFSIAYVVRDSAFLMMVKVASVIFSRARHKAFLSQAEAEDWLQHRYVAAA